MHPDEERLPLALPPGAMACPPPLNCVKAATYEKELPPAPLSPPLAFASIRSIGAAGACGDWRYGISPALKLGLQCSPSYRRRQPSSCVLCALSRSKSSLFLALTVTFTNVPLVMRCSVFYSLTYFVSTFLSRLYILLPITLATPPRYASFRLWMRLHEWRSPCFSVRNFPFPRACGLSPCPYSVTGLAIV